MDGCDETPPELTAGALVEVGLGVTTFVGAGFGVWVGCGVAVGAGVLVGGTGVAVGGTGVLVAVGSGVAVGGTGVAVGSNVAVGSTVGTSVGAGGATGVVHAASNRLNIKLTNMNLPDIFDIPCLLSSDLTGRRMTGFPSTTFDQLRKFNLLLAQGAERLV